MHLAACDQAKRNDLDGRGNLSEENLAEFTRFFEAVLFRGELPRSDTAAIVGTGDHQARRVVSALLKLGVLASESSRATGASRLRPSTARRRAARPEMQTAAASG
jgi:Fic family protein